MHKCQGFGQLLALPTGRAAARYELIDTTLDAQRGANERSLFDGIDLSLQSLGAYAGASTPRDVTGDLARISDHVKRAQAAFDGGNDEGTIAPLAAGLAALRALRGKLSALDASARYELDFRLAQKERQFADALVLAQPLRIEVLADDGVVVPGQALKVTAIVANRGATPVEVRSFGFSGFDGAE
jgi:hypothetical protein